MANNKKEEKMVAVTANYPVVEETAFLWGVPFKSDGKKEPKYVANVNAETAKSLIDAKRAK